MNIIHAIINLINAPTTRLSSRFQSNNRANSQGKALEEFIQDLFAGSLQLNGERRAKALRASFSWLGNANNPPDAMLRNGDAIEVKKIAKPNSVLALNSSHPKHKLYAHSPLIAKACRDAEKWTKKDIIYAVGVVEADILKHLCFVYGEDYCADDAVYTRVKSMLKRRVESHSDLDFSATNELGRINSIGFA